MEAFIIVYEHEYGADLYRIQTDETLFVERMIESDDVQAQVAEHLGLNFEPALGETLVPHTESAVTELGAPLILEIESDPW